VTTFLLDVNVLIALLDPAHLNHDSAHAWFANTGNTSWATCPLTENAVVRILSNPAYPSIDWSPTDVIQHLNLFLSNATGHVFWEDSVSFLDPQRVNHKLITGHRQITDIYLLALAVSKRATLATFDRSIPLAAISEASETSIFLLD